MVRSQKSTGNQSGTVKASRINPKTGKEGKAGLWFLPEGTNFREYPTYWRYGLKSGGGLLGSQVIGQKSDYPTADSFAAHILSLRGSAQEKLDTDRAAAKAAKAAAKAAAKTPDPATDSATN